MTLSCASHWILVVDVHPPRVVIRGRPPTCTFRSEHNIPYRPWCNQTGSDLGMRLRGDLPKSRVRLLDWCANPPGGRPHSRRSTTCSELACCGRRPPRVVIVVVRHPPRVVIRGRPATCTFRWADKIPYRPACYGRRPSSSRYRGANPAPSCGFDWVS